jgi:sigma-B regulation protein RsbU (phosphoserine phosphatase)
VSPRDPLAAAQREAQLAADELSERYEEINLLYGIGESLGRTVALEEAAASILGDIASTVGARRGVILVHDPERAVLSAVARRGVPEAAFTTVPVAHATLLLARAFRTRQVVLADAAHPRDDDEQALPGELLAVPILWTTPGGGEALGVLALADRAGHEPFSAGDQKLLAAIATQIGAAIENARLVRTSLAQQRLAQEMQLAHDLQMKLLPPGSVVAPHATAAARVIPAESVGGDFYHLFRLPGERTGVMIGDVSGHGYQAALIMALTMSAAAIHAQRTADPAKVLRALVESLADELVSTEMYFTVCYAVIDKRRGRVRYANLGHPHVFVVHATGEAERLAAQAPPLGLGDSTRIAVTTLPWVTGDDLLLGFTDGIVDARTAAGAAFGEARVLDTVRPLRAAPVEQIVGGVFDALRAHTGREGAGDDCTVVAVRA